MTPHERMESLADLYAAGGLPADERREVDQHAAACAGCASMLRDARAFATWMRGAIKPDAPPPDLEDRLVAAFRAAGAPKKRRFSVSQRLLKVTGSIAAAVGLIFVGNAFAGPEGSTSLKTLSSAESDFRANDRTVDEFWTTNVAGLYDKGKDNFKQFFGRNLGEPEDGYLSLSRLQTRGGDDSKLAGLGAERGLKRLEDVKEIEKLGKEETAQRKLSESLGEADSPAPVPNPEPAEAAPKEAPKSGATFSLEEPAPEKDSKPNKSPETVQDAKKIIRTADVSLEVDSYEATYTKLSELVTAEKGQIANSNTQKMANGKIQATVTIRILPERFDALLGKLKDFGTVRHQDIGSQDVTKAYIDLETRLKSKEILAERLKKLLAEAKGNVKELMEVEVQLGATNEAIEQIKGEIKYYDNLIGMSTVTLHISEKDLGQPFEYVQTLQSNIAVTAKDLDDSYARAQKDVTDAGGQVVDSKMTRQSDGSATGTIRARVDAEKFPALREALKKLGTVTNDTVNQRKSARGGREGTPKADAPLRKEQAIIDLTISSPPLFVTRRSQLLVQTGEVEKAYQDARKAVEAAGGKIVDGSLTGHANGTSATVRAQVDADRFAALVDTLKAAGEVKNANVNQVLPALASDGQPQLLRERAEIELALVSPPRLLGEEHGILKTIRDTFAHSWAGLLWSIEKLFVGISLAGPWVAILIAAIWIWRKRKKAQPTA